MKEQPKNRSVLIVEDEASLLKGLGEKFFISGFKVLKATNGKDGLATALAEHPDIIIADVLMPLMGGFEMVKRLREDEWGKDAKVIIWSNSRNLDTEKEAKDLGVMEIWVKSDLNFSRIVERVNACLNDR